MLGKQLKLISCLVILTLITSCQTKPKDGHTDTYTSGKITIAADESFEPIVQEEIDVFQGLFPSTKIVPKYLTEVDAINLLLKDSVRVAFTSRTLTPEELNSFHSRKFYPKAIKIATDGLALIVNKNNPDTLITVNEIRKILTGKVNRWKEIYPKSRLKDFLIVFDNPNSSTVRFAMDSICKGVAISNKVKALRTNKQVIDFVAKTPHAIGIIGVNWLSNDNDTTGPSFNKRITVMSVSNEEQHTAVSCYKPYQAYLYYGNYPLTRSIYILLNDPRNALPWGFSTFVSSDKGQKIILKSGLVPATQPVRIVEIKDK
jgi:phosphate transport system substrate-binding protein